MNTKLCDLVVVGFISIFIAAVCSKDKIINIRVFGVF